MDIPTAKAKISNKYFDVDIKIEYLGKNGWEKIEMPKNRKLIMGAIKNQKNRTAMYKVSYIACKNGQKTAKVFTILNGLQMMIENTTNVGFLNEKFEIPKCHISYYYKNEKNIPKWIDNLELEINVKFLPKGNTIKKVVNLKNNCILPKQLGTYFIEYSSPQKIIKDGEIFVDGSYTLTKEIPIYKGRINPLKGKDGIYETFYKIENTSSVGVGMVNSSCKNKIKIEKQEGKYYIYFTQLAAQYMYNLNLRYGQNNLGKTLNSEQYMGANLQRQYIFALSEEMLGKKIYVSMFIGPMNRDVNFSIIPDLNNAYKIDAKIDKSEEKPALYEPVICDKGSQKYNVLLGKKFNIPKLDATLSGKECEVITNVYYINGDKKEYISIDNFSFTPKKTGTYFIEYIASSNKYTTSLGNPTTTKLERRIIVNNTDNENVTDDDNGKNILFHNNENTPQEKGIATWAIVLIIFASISVIGCVVYAIKKKLRERNEKKN